MSKVSLLHPWDDVILPLKLITREIIMNVKEKKFQTTVKSYYDKNGRDNLPWRLERTPFNAFLSEVMLQQTQVPRVIEKFTLFRSEFDSFYELANAPQNQIVKLWQGLGYNRRALFLHRACQMIVKDFNGELPKNRVDLEKLPGIGPATSASLMVYAHNSPVAFIETNIRAVYIHHFFKESSDIHDEQLLPLIEKTLDTHDPYHWYSALMDYGTMIKSEFKNPSRRSKHHSVQSQFEGSLRQVRGAVLRELSNNGSLKHDILRSAINDDRYDEVVTKLIAEKFIVEHNNMLHLV